MRQLCSTGLVLACATFLALGCGDNLPPLAASKPWRLAADSSAVSVKAGGMLVLRFTLVDKSGSGISTGTTGAGVPGERVELSVVPESDVAGATLSASSSLTDAQGVTSVVLMAGRPTMFEIAAQNPRADSSRTMVTVYEAPTATLSVIPILEDGFSPPRAVVSMNLSLYSDQLCSTFSPIHPPATARRLALLSIGAPTDVHIDPTVQTALLGQGYDAQGNLEAVGCVDVTSSLVLQSVNATIFLPLAAVPLAPAPTYNLSAHFSLAKRDLAARIAAPWQDLDDCPLDPGQLWLDCTLDALGTPTGSAIDCVLPAPGASPLADAIDALRAAPSAGSSCRPAVLENGVTSLDARLAALFPNPALSPERDLDSIVALASHVVDDFSVTSTLRLDATSLPGAFNATHTLQHAVFALGTQPIRSDVLALGLAQSQARFIDVSAAGTTLTVGEHRLALRLGTMARLAFEQAAGAWLGLPPGTNQIVEALFALAATEPGAAQKVGCPALDAVVCPAVSAAVGCVLAACVAGQAALVARLSAGFQSADGDGADLQLGGVVDMVDSDGDGVAETLGPGPPGKWLAQFRSAGPTESVTGELSTVLLP